MKIQRENVLSNFIWRFLERCGAQGVSFIVSIILARLLDPEAYGVVALVSVVITILQIVVDSGLGNALIQKKDADEIDFSTVFFTNLILCGFLYLLVFLFAPFLARFYEIPSLTSLIRVQSLILLVYGVKNVQEAYVAKNMLFKRFFFATLGGTIGAAVIGIWLAYRGFGVWALVVQHLFNTTVDTIILWITVKWRPQITYSFTRLKKLFSFGWKILATNLVDTTYNDLRSLVIGKKYSPSDLAYYERGRILPNLIVNNTNVSISNVLFPTLSSYQDDKNRVYDITRRAISTGLYVMTPLMIGLALCSEELVRLVFTDKWLPCVPFLMIYCFVYMFQPMQTSHNSMLKALGRSDLFLRLELIKKFIGITILLITMWFGVKVIAVGMLIDSVLCWIINSIVFKRFINYSHRDQIKDIILNILPGICMGIIVYFVGGMIKNVYIGLAIKVVVGMAGYILLSTLMKCDSYNYIMQTVKVMIKKKS